MADNDARAAGKKLLRVFISSTYLDNAKRRKLVADAVVDAGMFPEGMERFTASAHATVSECERLAAECDVFVGIIAYRYGWIPQGRGVSITELEYRAAKRAERPRLMFQLASKSLDPELDFDAGPDRGRKLGLLDAFKEAYSADQMPRSFSEETLQHEVYRALLAWKADRLSAEMPEASAAHSGMEKAQESYRRAIVAEHGSMALAGFATKLRAPIDLQHLYVPLHALVDLRSHGGATFADASDSAAVLGDRTEKVSLLDAFRVAKNRNRKALVILGDPGSGKTTHLKRLLLYCVRNDPTSLGLETGTLPMFLPLRELGGERDLSRFIEQQLTALQADLPVGLASRLLEHSRLLLLLDGLDEVADTLARNRIAHWIEKSVVSRQNCVVVVTCRYAGYGVAARFGPDFLELHLRPLTPEQAETFVRNWYSIVEVALAKGDVEARKATAGARADELISRLNVSDRRGADLVALARNPLLLANLCMVHRDTGSLPEGRACVYAECIAVLLQHWQQGKGLLVGASAEAAQIALQPIALWMHRNERRRATLEQLAPMLQPALATLQYRGAEAREFLRAIRDESGLLTGWGPNEYGFMHIGFQEYLAARELCRLFREGDLSTLQLVAASYGSSWWQEVIIMLFSLDEPGVFDAFMRAVLRHGKLDSNRELMELILEGAPARSPTPFDELLRETPGEDRALWSRQLHALTVLEARFPDSLEPLLKQLEHHPFEQISSRAAASNEPNSEPSSPVPSIVTRNGDVRLRWVEAPSFALYAGKGFYIGNLVTNEEYTRFLKANQSVHEPAFWADRHLNRGAQPVMLTCVDAAKFAKWAGCRLPTFEEWNQADCVPRIGTRTAHRQQPGHIYQQQSGPQRPVNWSQLPSYTPSTPWEWYVGGTQQRQVRFDMGPELPLETERYAAVRVGLWEAPGSEPYAHIETGNADYGNFRLVRLR